MDFKLKRANCSHIGLWRRREERRMELAPDEGPYDAIRKWYGVM